MLYSVNKLTRKEAFISCCPVCIWFLLCRQNDVRTGEVICAQDLIQAVYFVIKCRELHVGCELHVFLIRNHFISNLVLGSPK